MVKLHKLEESLEAAGFVLEEAVPLFAALCSLPLSDAIPAEPGTSATKAADTGGRAGMAAEGGAAARVPDDGGFHWVDPSTLELLTLLIDQVPLARLLVVLTCRPDFTPPWVMRSHVTHIAVGRLTRPERADDREGYGRESPPG